MKKALIQTLCDLMANNDNVYLFTGDLGYGVMNPIHEQYKKRFINAATLTTEILPQKQRIVFLDWLRAAACLMVMLVHSSECVYSDDYSFSFMRSGSALHRTKTG